MRMALILVFAIAAMGMPSQVAAQVSAKGLEKIAMKLLRKNDIRLQGLILVDPERSGGVAGIAFRGNEAVIFVHPVAMTKIPTNTWAFILGHELAHQQRNTGNEAVADVVGAQYAIRAGYDLKSYVEWIYQFPNVKSRPHGYFHDRARRLEKHYGITAESDMVVTAKRVRRPLLGRLRKDKG